MKVGDKLICVATQSYYKGWLTVGKIYEVSHASKKPDDNGDYDVHIINDEGTEIYWPKFMLDDYFQKFYISYNTNFILI
jgi:hypothetical protein